MRCSTASGRPPSDDIEMSPEHSHSIPSATQISTSSEMWEPDVARRLTESAARWHGRTEPCPRTRASTRASGSPQPPDAGLPSALASEAPLLWYAVVRPRSLRLHVHSTSWSSSQLGPTTSALAARTRSASSRSAVTTITSRVDEGRCRRCDRAGVLCLDADGVSGLRQRFPSRRWRVPGSSAMHIKTRARSVRKLHSASDHYYTLYSRN
jgi:hypothetical protein